MHSLLQLQRQLTDALADRVEEFNPEVEELRGDAKTKESGDCDSDFRQFDKAAVFGAARRCIRMYLGLLHSPNPNKALLEIIPVPIGPFDHFHTLKTLGVARL
jgi:hypothetical protein